MSLYELDIYLLHKDLHSCNSSESQKLIQAQLLKIGIGN